MIAVKACSHWIWIQTSSVTELPKANSMRIQCASIAWFASTLHCAEPNSRVHVDHTSTQLPWRPRQIFTSASHHIASRVEQIRGTQCVARRSALTVGEHAHHALFGPHAQGAIARSSSIRIETTCGSGLGLIRIGSGLDECAFSVNALKPDSIRFNAHWVSSVNRPLDLFTCVIIVSVTISLISMIFDYCFFVTIPWVYSQPGLFGPSLYISNWRGNLTVRYF